MGRFSYITAVSSDPAATGAEHSYTVPEDVRLTAFQSVLVTDANAADRQPKVFVEDDKGNIIFQTVAVDVQDASKTRTYVGHAGIPGQAVNTVSLIASMFLPEDGVFIPKGGKIKTLTAGVQATDNWGTMKFLFERR